MAIILDRLEHGIILQTCHSVKFSAPSSVKLPFLLVADRWCVPKEKFKLSKTLTSPSDCNFILQTFPLAATFQCAFDSSYCINARTLKLQPVNRYLDSNEHETTACGDANNLGSICFI